MKLKKLKINWISILTIVIFLTAIILLNIFAGMLTERFFLKIDLTEAGLYTLSDKAEDFLRDIDETVDIVVLSDESAWFANSTLSLISNILKNYSATSGGHLRIQYVNPDLNSFDGPDYNNSLAVLKESHTELEDMARNDIIFISSKRVTKVPVNNLFTQNYDQYGYPTDANIRADQELVSALTYVLNEQIARVVFVTNHQEDNTEYIKMVFERSGYDSSSINLAIEDIPEDTIVLITAAPKFDFLSEEIVKLEAFSATGGNIMILYDINTTKLPVLDNFMAEWGVAVENKLIFDEEYTFIPQLGVIGAIIAQGALPSTTSSAAYTREIPLGVYSARPLRAVWGDGASESLQPLVQTVSSSSYAKDLSDGNLTTWERESGDESGPFTLAYHSRILTRNAEGSQVYSNLLIFGGSMFDDTFLSIYGETFYNAILIADLANDLNPFGERIYISPKGLTESQMLVSAGGARAVLIFMVILVPLTIITAGVLVWRKRRHL